MRMSDPAPRRRLCLRCWPAAPRQARADDIIVFGTVAAKSALEQIAPAFERDTHHKLVLHIATTGELAADIDKGAPFDVALLTQAALDDLIRQGKLDAAGKLDVARVGVGVAVAKGVAPPAIGNAEEFKQALLAAKSITYTAQGATGPTMKKIFERFGIARRDAGQDRHRQRHDGAAGRGGGAGGRWASRRSARSSTRRPRSWPGRCRPSCRCIRRSARRWPATRNRRRPRRLSWRR